jgi:uncharacterized protein (TIGR03083 family)
VDHVACIDALEAEVVRMRSDLDDVAWYAPVPSCPEWDVVDLVKHVGRVHRWATAMVRDVTPERVGWNAIDFELPHDVRQYGTWFAEGGARLVDTLRAADPDAAMWAWGADQHARFWSRRMLHETAVHHADLRVALRLEPRLTVEPSVAADGIDELLDNLPTAAYFVPGVKELRGDGETVHLHATDDADPAEWTITLGPDGFTYDHSHGKGTVGDSTTAEGRSPRNRPSHTVSVRAAAADLLLLLMNRRSLARDGDRFEVFGERAPLEHWLRHATL